MTNMLQKYGDDFKKVFSSYQLERLPRASKVQKSARLWGEIIHTDDPVKILLRNTIMERRSSCDYSYADWLYSKRYKEVSFHSNRK